METTIHILICIVLIVLLMRIDSLEQTGKKTKQKIDKTVNELLKRRIINDNSEHSNKS